MSKEVLEEFTEKTGYTVKVEPNGDAGQLTNKLVLTKGSPIADAGLRHRQHLRVARRRRGRARRLHPEGPAVLGVDATRSTTPADAAQLTPGRLRRRLRQHRRRLVRATTRSPRRRRSTTSTDPDYKDLFVTPGASSSSPGLAFLLATVAKYGEDGWQDYWEKLMANGTKITSGWSDAYEVDFTAGGGDGDRPIVLSYASSPPFTIPEGEPRADHERAARHLLPAGRVRRRAGGREEPEGRAGVRRLHGRSRSFQEALPDNMYVFPVDPTVPRCRPTGRSTRRSRPSRTPSPPADIAKNRDTWLREWSDVTSR